MTQGVESFYQRARNAVDEGLVRFGAREPDMVDSPEQTDRIEGLDTVELDSVSVDRSQLERYLDTVEQSDALGVAGHSRHFEDDPRLFNEAVAVHESLSAYEELGVIEDAQQLSKNVFSQIVNDRGLAQGLTDLEAVEENDSYSTVDRRAIPSLYMNEIIPEMEGGEAEPFRFTYDGDGWRPVQRDVDQGIEVIRKPDNPGAGGKTPVSTPGGMYRLRTGVEFVDGEPRSTWREDPTKYTEDVRGAAREVMEEVSEQHPGVELSLFGSPENGTMKPGSDIEHALHVPIEYVDGPDSIEDLEENDYDVRREVDSFRSEIIGKIAEESSVDLSGDAYSYVSIRGQDVDYAMGRNNHGGDQDRRMIIGEEADFVDYDQHLEQKGLEEKGDIRASGLLS